jgi:hypothetical protein
MSTAETPYVLAIKFVIKKPPVATFIPITHSVSQSGHLGLNKEAPALCRKHKLNSATQYLNK